MSYTLNELIAQAADGLSLTATLSAESVAVMLYGLGFLDEKKNWLDRASDPLDEITDADWDAIEKLVGNAVYELLTEAEAGLIVGEYKMMSHNDVPEKWLLCRGSVVSEAAYPELFEAIGHLYDTGGEGAGNFRLPNFGDRSPFGAPSDIYIGATGGNLTESLNVTNLPEHTHQQTNNTPAAAYRHTGTGGANPSMAFTNGTTNSTQQLRTQPTGGGAPFSILHPILFTNVIIYAGR